MLSQRRRGSAQPARNGRGSCVADRWLTVACGSAVADTGAFAVVVLIGAVVGLLAVLSNRLSERIHVPAPALFLVAAAAATRLVPDLQSPPEQLVERVVTVALLCILFDGGMHLGWSRFRRSAAPIAVIGVAGTFLTAAAADRRNRDQPR